jgi:hypothetical protein
MTPVSGSLLSALFIPGEIFTIQLFWGLLLVTVGIIAINRPKKINQLWNHN